MVIKNIRQQLIMTTVSSIHIYPIKSSAGISVKEAKVEKQGLAFDRQFILSEPSGNFITARTDPKLCLVKTRLLINGIELTAPFMPKLILNYDDFAKSYQKVIIWGDIVSGQHCSKNADSWFSQYLQRPCHLLFFGHDSKREKYDNDGNLRKVAFADGYPLLLISKGSLNYLNEQLEQKYSASNHQEAVAMAQFRPNIVVDDCLPFAEDGWQNIRIGHVEFSVSKPCERCVFTTINPKDGVKNPLKEPLQTLKSFRKTDSGEVIFGQNLVPLTTGKIYQGDKLTIMSNQPSPVFNNVTLVNKPQSPKTTPIDNDEISIQPNTKSMPKKITITFEKWNKSHKVTLSNNDLTENEQTLLENGEDAGLILPYSCRAGMCGRCHAKLISGDVNQLSTDGLTEQEVQDGYILCCSSIAISDVVIQHS